MTAVMQIGTDRQNRDILGIGVTCRGRNTGIVTGMHIERFDTVHVRTVHGDNAVAERMRLTDQTVIGMIDIVKIVEGKVKTLDRLAQERFVNTEDEIVIVVFLKAEFRAEQNDDTVLLADALCFIKIGKLRSDRVFFLHERTPREKVIGHDNRVISLFLQTGNELCGRQLRTGRTGGGMCVQLDFILILRKIILYFSGNEIHDDKLLLA